MAGVLKVKRQLESEKRARHLRLHHSQLQRGNLRPLGRPVTASGPAMSQCKGIVAGKPVHSLCTACPHLYASHFKQTSLD